MSWKIIEKYRRLLEIEEGCVTKGWGGKLTVCLVYPSHYRAGMSNLGFQWVYGFLNDCSDVVCERAFLPAADEVEEYRASRTPLLSIESQKPLHDFDVIAFSVSFETDYLNIPKILSLARIPHFAAERTASSPLVLAGGAATFLNPEPIAEMMDMLCVGEGEVLLPPLLQLLNATGGMDRKALLDEAAKIPGIYVPSLFTVDYDHDEIGGISVAGDHPSCIERGFAGDLDSSATGSRLFTPDTEFSEMFLVELSRGCPRGCRFCAAGFIYEPYRQRSLESVRAQAVTALESHGKIGLVGAAVGDFKGIGPLCRSIREQGGKVTVASLRIDRLDDELIDVLVESGHKTVSLAPEGPSQRLRDLVKKGITTEQILAACGRLIARNILNLKLYFIVGLPTETMADIEEMLALVEEIRRQVTEQGRANRRLGQIQLSVNPFIPKPFTPFQWCGMAPVKELEKRINYLKRALAKMPNVRLQSEGLRDAVLQAVISRGDRRLAGWLVKAAETGSWSRAAKDMGIHLEEQATRTIPLDAVLPWSIICCREPERLEREYRRAFDGSSGEA